MPNRERVSTPYKEQRDAEKKIFARRLWREMTSRQWSQADLARQAGIGRDVIGGYVRALNLPNPPHAKKLADAFGIPVEQLFPSTVREVETARESLPEVEMRSTGDGKAMLHVNLEVPRALAVKILALLESDV